MKTINRQDGTPALSIRHMNPVKPREIVRGEWVEIWKGIDEIQIDLGDRHWYGGGGLVHQQYPLEKLAMFKAPFITSDNGSTGLLGILHPFWWTSDGVGILVSGDTLDVGFNAPLEGQPFSHSFDKPAPFDQRPQLASEVQGDHLLTISGNQLEINFFMAANPRQVIEMLWNVLSLNQNIEIPPFELIEHPLWTTWAHFKNDISHDKVMDYAQQIGERGFTASILGIDDRWQAAYGDTRFDLNRFPNPRETVEAIHDLGFRTTLWFIPFFVAESRNRQAGLEKGYMLHDSKGDPYQDVWWADLSGESVFLDVANPEAMAWHLDNLTALAEETGVDGFKFDAGEALFYNKAGMRLAGDVASNRANHLYIKHIAERFPWSDIRSAWFNQGMPMLFRQWDKSSTWGFANGLASCITQAITLNMLGYPYSFPDMIGGNEYGEEQVTAELLIRWTQAVSPMPIIQFSIPPWRFGEECVRICARYNQLHDELAPRTYEIVKQVRPIVCPLWWIAPMDEQALVCDDEYLIGDDLLVAPVIIDGERQRDIYLPQGQWRSYWNHAEVHDGGRWLHNYPAPLDVLPLFERINA